MRTIDIIAVMLVLTGGASVLTPLSGRAPAQQQAEEKKAPPLIRMDLLSQAPAQTGPPKRNIFSPRIGFVGRVEPAVPAPVVPGRPPGNPGVEATLSDSEAAAQPAAPVFSVEVRYIGFVDSRRTGKIIGLIIFQGQAQAVVEGDVINEGIRIGKISRKEIEVILPDASARIFPLEGEE